MELVIALLRKIGVVLCHHRGGVPPKNHDCKTSRLIPSVSCRVMHRSVNRLALPLRFVVPQVSKNDVCSTSNDKFHMPLSGWPSANTPPSLCKIRRTLYFSNIPRGSHAIRAIEYLQGQSKVKGTPAWLGHPNLEIEFVAARDQG